LLTLLVILLYAPALNYGLIWDDPRYYSELRTRHSLFEIFTTPQPPTNQFYRPLAVLYGQAIIRPDGVVNAPLAHVLQIAAHLIGSLALAPVLQALRFRSTQARLAAVCFAMLPLAYFGVAWQQNQQPLIFMWLMLSVLTAHLYQSRGGRWWLGLSLLCWATALLFQEGAAPFVFVFFWLHWTHTPRKWSAWPLLHIGVVMVYALVWLSMPLQRGVTGQGFQFVVLTYFLQGVVYPVSALLTPWIKEWPVPGLFTLYAAAWLAFSAWMWRTTSLRLVALCWVWTAVGVGPLWAGLSWDYAQLGPRLIYPAALGVTGLWGSLMAQTFDGKGWGRAIGAAACVAVAWVSVSQWQAAQRVFTAGTQHLARTVEVLTADPSRRLLFVNYPDRLEIRPPLYPLGFYGLILAPPVQSLSDYARALRGPSASDESLAAFLTGAAERDAWPHRVDMRGVNSAPEVLWEAVQTVDAVYLSDYLPDGTLRLREAGGVRNHFSDVEPLARVGAALLSGELQREGDRVRVQLRWQCTEPLQFDDTVFVHLWRGEEFILSADGDSVGELIPLRVWQPGAEIEDVRWIEASVLPSGEYTVRVGLYNRGSGARSPVTVLSGAQAGSTTDTLILGTFSVP
jgi:hypothetical protein